MRSFPLVIVRTEKQISIWAKTGEVALVFWERELLSVWECGRTMESNEEDCARSPAPFPWIIYNRYFHSTLFLKYLKII